MAQQPPNVHPKNPPTGKGKVDQTPGNASMGNSMHKPVTAYSDQQQEQRT
ncbi:MAG TPA: hypothetical protein VNN25_03900 [Thermoanaerobaculia bacterium]|nr:hypothetical protein [Thermoanaerobaculia bacterium]